MSKLHGYVGSKVTNEMIYNSACQAWDIPREVLFKKTRLREIVEPRMAVFYYKYRKQRDSPLQIVKNTEFNRATVHNASKKVEIYLEVDPAFRSRYELFEMLLK